MQAFTNTETDPRVQGVLAGALATAGRNQPGLVIPVLIGVFTNLNTHTAPPSESPAWELYEPFWGGFPFLVYDGSEAGARNEIADALAAFGRDARLAVPMLRQAGQSTNVELRIHVAVALQTIAPEMPDALASLLKNLANPDKHVRLEALETLVRLGTNTASALPALTRQGLLDPDPEIQEAAIRAQAGIGLFNDEVISTLGKNAVDSNEKSARPAARILGPFCQTIPAGLSELAQVMTASPVGSARQTARGNLQN